MKGRELKVALVCDWLVTVGGAERVLLELHHMYPDAPIYTSKYDKKGIDWFSDADVRTGYLQIFPNCLRRFLSPLRQRYFSKLDLTAYDLVISVTGAEAKAVKTKQTERNVKNRTGKTSEFSTGGGKTAQASQTASGEEPRTLHLCYCHVPTQYYWSLSDEYLKNPGFGPLNPLARLGLKLFLKPMRKKDFAAAGEPDYFITISNYAKQEIAKYYKREATVIHPPVDTKTFKKKKSSPVENFEQHNCSKSQYFITTARQVTWKHLDLCVKSCLQTHQNLILIGDGPEHQYLEKLAAAGKADKTSETSENSPSIVFLPKMSQEELKPYLENATAYLFPSKEPFGIAPVEALAAGVPVIAYQEGGSQDFIRDGENGLFFEKQSVNSLSAAIEKFLKLKAEGKFSDPEKIRASALPFDTEKFKQEMERFIYENQT